MRGRGFSLSIRGLKPSNQSGNRARQPAVFLCLESRRKTCTVMVGWVAEYNTLRGNRRHGFSDAGLNLPATTCLRGGEFKHDQRISPCLK